MLRLQGWAMGPPYSSFIRVFTKRLRLRPTDLRIFVVGGLFDRTTIPTLPGPTERIWKTRKFRFVGWFFHVLSCQGTLSPDHQNVTRNIPENIKKIFKWRKWVSQNLNFFGPPSPSDPKGAFKTGNPPASPAFVGLRQKSFFTTPFSTFLCFF